MNKAEIIEKILTYEDNSENEAIRHEESKCGII